MPIDRPLLRARRYLSVAVGVLGLALTPIVLVRAYYEVPDPIVAQEAAAEGAAPPAAEIVYEWVSESSHEGSAVQEERETRTIERSQPQTRLPKNLGFAWPVHGSITSPFGPRGEGFHHGVDIGCGTGAAIRASYAGTVFYAGEARVYGKVVAVDHGSGYMTVYAHLSEFAVRVGDRVDRGQVVGLCGSTGRSTGPHLHFELRYGNTVFDPLRFLS